jgi:hypothetical protein
LPCQNFGVDSRDETVEQNGIIPRLWEIPSSSRVHGKAQRVI